MAPSHLPPTVQTVRIVVWVGHMVMPLAGLWLLLARPELDVGWNHPASHFWLVLSVAFSGTVLGGWVSVAAWRRGDARLALVSLAFLSGAGFFVLHALATPGVLVAGANRGFDLAQPVGLALAAGFAALSALPLSGRAADLVLRHHVSAWIALAQVALLWAAVSLWQLPPLHGPPGTREVEGPMVPVALAATAGYLFAAVRYFQLYRRRPSVMLVSLITAFVLLAEATVAVALADRWQLSWWTWHLLLVFAFGFVVYSAWVQYRREGGTAGLFDAVTLADTARRIREQYETALEELVSALRRRAQGAGDDGPSVASRLADRFALTEGQTAVLDRAGAALASERETSARLAALVTVGEHARVGLREEDFLAAVQGPIERAYGPVTLALAADGEIRCGDLRVDPDELTAPGPHQAGDRTLYPLTVRGRVAGVLVASPGAGEPTLVAALANQLSVALENARLYGELEGLFRSYLSPDVAAALLADPGQAALGGSLVEVTALFADLRGFTTFSEGVPPAEIVAMLNRYHGAAVPCVLEHGGTVVQFVGDALLAVWGAPARQPDHALQAVRAAWAMQQAVAAIADERPEWPQFRIGVNTGPALVGNIGSEALRGFNAMGDAVNVAARLQGLAEPGQIVVGEATRQSVVDGAPVQELGELTVKGRRRPVRAHVVTGRPGG